MDLEAQTKTIQSLMELELQLKTARLECQEQIETIQKLEKDGKKIIQEFNWQDERIKTSSLQRIVQYAIRSTDATRGNYKFLNMMSAIEEIEKQSKNGNTESNEEEEEDNQNTTSQQKKEQENLRGKTDSGRGYRGKGRGGKGKKPYGRGGGGQQKHIHLHLGL